MQTAKVYLCPKDIAELLKLTSIRIRLADGRYVLSGQDLQGYGVEAAVRDGAEPMAIADYKKKFNQNK